MTDITQDLYKKIFKTLLGKIKDDPSEWKDLLYSWIKTSNYKKYVNSCSSDPLTVLLLMRYQIEHNSK